jgi:hypothetical protein
MSEPAEQASTATRRRCADDRRQGRKEGRGRLGGLIGGRFP